jgi:endonuclease III
MPGEAWVRRGRLLDEFFVSIDSVNKHAAQQVLDNAGYRFPSSGVAVILAAKAIVFQPGFSWGGYVRQANVQYESDFRSDQFLKVKGVSYKTRDLALSELSDHFVAIDLHVIRVTTRTGLLLHGYGDPRITTDVSKPAGYLFFHDLMLKLSRRTGWPDSGYSPGEIDKMLWNFGRALCGATPRCGACPIVQTCLTQRQHARG